MAFYIFRNIKAGRKKKNLMLLLHILLIYAVVVMLAYLFQNRMIYLPNRTSLETMRHTAEIYSLKLWPREDIHYRGFISQNSPETVKGTVIVFHGNAGSAHDRIYYIQPLQRLGYRVLLAEYPGYGARSGKTGEKSFIADGRSIVREVKKEFGEPVYLWGESLGGGIVSAITADQTLKIEGIVLLTPWNSLSATAQAHYWFLPARWLVRDRFDNIRNLKQFTGPVAVLMADQDTVIPNRLTLDLYKSITSPKRFWTFEGADHNNWSMDPGLNWWNEVMDFISGKLPETPPKK